jgi:hypothetical protein
MFSPLSYPTHLTIFVEYAICGSSDYYYHYLTTTLSFHIKRLCYFFNSAKKSVNISTSFLYLLYLPFD